MFPNRNFVLARLARETKDPSLLWLLSEISYPGDQHFLNTIDPNYYSETQLTRDLRVGTDSYALLVLDDLSKPVPPLKAGVPTNFMDRGRGLVSFRSGWKPDDTMVLFDGSHRNTSAPGHEHASCGHFSVSALGEYFAIDTGRYGIEQDQHNIVLVDGKSGHSTNGEWRNTHEHGLLIDYQPDNFCDFAAVDSSHQHNCYWSRRSLGFVKGSPMRPEPLSHRRSLRRSAGRRGEGAPSYIWTVEDINKANDWAEFWWTLNTHPNNTIETFPDHGVIHGCRQGNLLDIHFALPAPESFPKPHTLAVMQDIGRCSSYKYVHDIDQFNGTFKDANSYLAPERAVLIRPRLVAKISGYNGRFMSVMIPRRKGGKPAKVERLPSVDNSLAVRITFAEVEDTLIWAYEHHLLEAGGIRGRGQWCVVRQSRKSGKVLAFQMGYGTSLEVGGNALKL